MLACTRVADGAVFTLGHPSGNPVIRYCLRTASPELLKRIDEMTAVGVS